MGQIRHGSATTTHAARAAIHRSQASAAELSRSYGINAKTLLKWRKPTTAEGPRSTVLSEEEEAIIVRIPVTHAAGTGGLPTHFSRHSRI